MAQKRIHAFFRPSSTANSNCAR